MGIEVKRNLIKKTERLPTEKNTKNKRKKQDRITRKNGEHIGFNNKGMTSLNNWRSWNSKSEESSEFGNI